MSGYPSAKLAIWLLAALGLAVSGKAEAASDSSLRPDTQVTFAELGWEEDVVLTPSSPVAGVEFELPPDAKQGSGVWYAAQLAYEWSGIPPTDQPAYLYGLWNGQAMYQLKIKRQSEFPIGQFMWSMVDGIWGGSAGTEFSSRFSGRSTNFATVSAIKPGRNRLELQLDLTYARSSDITVKVLRDSKVIATRWGPPLVKANGSMNLRNGQIAVDMHAHNSGLPTVELVAQLLVIYSDGERQLIPVTPEPDGGIRQHWRIRESVDLTRADPSTVHLLLNWGTGQAPYRIWPRDADPWWRHPPGWSTPAVLVAIVVLWISLPAAVRGAFTPSRPAADA